MEGYAGVVGELLGAGVGVAEDADADEADDRGDEVAVALEAVEGLVGLIGRALECDGRTRLGLRLKIQRGAGDELLRGGRRGCRSGCWVSFEGEEDRVAGGA